MRFEWEKAYVSVVFETDWTSLPSKIAVVESEIADRQLMLMADHGGTAEERIAIERALSALHFLRVCIHSQSSRASCESIRQAAGRVRIQA
jgi:hypothetical protein